MERLERFERLERQIVQARFKGKYDEANDSAVYGTPGGLVLPS